jgi:hypothetical protein
MCSKSSVYLVLVSFYQHITTIQTTTIGRFCQIFVAEQSFAATLIFGTLITKHSIFTIERG